MALTAEQEMQRNALAQQLMSGQGDPNTRNAVLNEWAALEGMRRDPYGFDPYGSGGGIGQGPNTSATGPSPQSPQIETVEQAAKGPSHPAPQVDIKDTPPPPPPPPPPTEQPPAPLAATPVVGVQVSNLDPPPGAPVAYDPGKSTIEDNPTQTQTGVIGEAKGEAGVQAPAPQQEMELTDPQALNTLDFQSMLDNPGPYGVGFNGIGGLPGFGATGLPSGVGTQGVQGVPGMAPTEGVPYAGMFGDPQGMTVGAQGNPGAFGVGGFGVGGFANPGGMAPTAAVPYTGVEYEDMPGMGLPGAAPEISGMSPTSYGVQPGEFGENPYGEPGDPMGYDELGYDDLDGLDGAPGGDPGGMDDQDGAPGGGAPGGTDDQGGAPGGGDPGGQDEDGQDGPGGQDGQDGQDGPGGSDDDGDDGDDDS